MSLPPLKLLHADAALSLAKLREFDKLSTREFIDSLRPGTVEALRVRPDGTMLNGHHRIKVLRNRGIDVDALPREIVAADSPPKGAGLE